MLTTLSESHANTSLFAANNVTVFEFAKDASLVEVFKGVSQSLQSWSQMVYRNWKVSRYSLSQVPADCPGRLEAVKAVMSLPQMLKPFADLLDSQAKEAWEAAYLRTNQLKIPWAKSKHNYAGWIPGEFHWDTSYERIQCTKPCMTNVLQLFKRDFFHRLSQSTGIKFYNIDMNACHFRIAVGLGQLEHNRRALLSESVWDEIGKGFPLEVRHLMVKPLLKKIVYTCFNGGNLRNFKNTVKTIYPEYYKDLPNEREMGNRLWIEKAILNNPAFNEIARLNSRIAELGLTSRLYSPITGKPVPLCEGNGKALSGYKFISRLLAFNEVILLLEELRLIIEGGGLPISLEHDGVIAAFLDEPNDSFQRSFEAEMSRFSEQLINFPLQVKFDEIKLETADPKSDTSFEGLKGL